MLKPTYENKMQPVTDTGQFEQNIRFIASAALDRFLSLTPLSCDQFGGRAWGDSRSIFARHFAAFTKKLSDLPSELVSKQADEILSAFLPGGRPWLLLPGVPEPQLLTADAQIRDREIDRTKSNQPKAYARFRDGKWQGREAQTGEWKVIETESKW